MRLIRFGLRSLVCQRIADVSRGAAGDFAVDHRQKELGYAAVARLGNGRGCRGLFFHAECYRKRLAVPGRRRRMHMILSILGGTPLRARFIPSITARRVDWLSLAVAAGTVLCCSVPQIALAYDPAGPTSGTGDVPFVKRTFDPHGSAQRLNLAKGRSIIVETSVAVSRVEAMGKDIVGISVVSPKQLLLIGNEYGVTQVMVWSDDGKQHVFEINVELDLDLLNAAFAEIDPQSDARAVSMMGNVLLVGTVSGLAMAEQMESVARLFINRLATNALVENNLRVAGEQQVLLRCVVAEISRSASRELGINGFLAGDNVKDGFVINQIGGILGANISPAAGLDVSGVIPFLTGDIGVSPGTTLTLGFPRANLEFFLKAMADNSLLRVLAEPTLVAISGETASFLAGGEFPVPVPQSGGSVGAITIEYKEFGVNLQFTPVVLPHQRIRVRVRPEVSTRDETRGLQTPTGFVPAITTRRIETTVEVDNGATLAIAGLLQDEVRGVATRLPGIGDLPILGALFRSVRYQRQRTELIILVTVELVASMNPSEVPELPGHNLLDPTDMDLYVNGTIEVRELPLAENDFLGGDERRGDLTSRRRLQPSDPQRMALHGPWGYAGPGESRTAGAAASPK